MCDVTVVDVMMMLKTWPAWARWSRAGLRDGSYGAKVIAISNSSSITKYVRDDLSRVFLVFSFVRSPLSPFRFHCLVWRSCGVARASQRRGATPTHQVSSSGLQPAGVKRLSFLRVATARYQQRTRSDHQRSGAKGDGSKKARSVPFHSIRFDSIRFDSVPLRSVPLRSVAMMRAFHRRVTGDLALLFSQVKLGAFVEYMATGVFRDSSSSSAAGRRRSRGGRFDHGGDEYDDDDDDDEEEDEEDDGGDDGDDDEDDVDRFGDDPYVGRGMGWNGMEWTGMEWNGMEWNGMATTRTASASHLHLYLPLLCNREVLPVRHVRPDDLRLRGPAPLLAAALPVVGRRA